MKKVVIYTDGSCSGNPGPGGWGAILRYKNIEKELSGGEHCTTNNRMELSAAIFALSSLKEPCEIDLYSDSKYLIDSVTKGWVYSWQKKGWMRTSKEKALNSDLWILLLEQLKIHKVNFIWVKGHDGHPENERCDALAVAQTEKHK